ncbi:hypothetical protein [Actinophytocola sp.]|uniref:hypothetical protein n=1 Tax=Actinophytocola sp. TaxID=1872138 RepID=UPI002D7FBF28|nr:hypothetical protein [Actinophytocola sp.]HET9141400.1 hypothetical protein [Actinophytocola sp.]
MAERTSRLGFAVEVVGFELRPAAAQDEIEHRLRTVVTGTLGDVRVDAGRADGTDIGGARLTVVLPDEVDPARTLPGLLMATANRLAADNLRFPDRMRLRMAIGAGSGRLDRLLGSDPLWLAMARNPEANVVVLLSAALHENVARPGPPDPALGRLHRADPSPGAAWLWIGPDQTVR